MQEADPLLSGVDSKDTLRQQATHSAVHAARPQQWEASREAACRCSIVSGQLTQQLQLWACMSSLSSVPAESCCCAGMWPCTPTECSERRLLQILQQNTHASSCCTWTRAGSLS